MIAEHIYHGLNANIDLIKKIFYQDFVCVVLVKMINSSNQGL